MLKVTAVGLGLATMLSLNPGITGYASQNQYPMSQKVISLNGMKIASPICLAAVDPSTKQMTTYIPIYYVMQMLKKLNIESQWDGAHWNLQFPHDLSPDVSEVSLGSGTITVSLNGTQVQTENEIVSLDPASDQNTTYVPIYYVSLLLKRMGLSSTWNGTTWSITMPNRPIYGGNLTLDSDSRIIDADPAKAYDVASQSLLSQVYDTLVKYDNASKTVIPETARTFEVSADGLTYTFHLRDDVKFSNGDPVTATSFVDEFERVLSPETSSPAEGFLDPIVVGSTDYFHKNSQSVRGIYAQDSQTLVIQLNQPEPFFLQVLTLPFFSAVDKSYIQKVGDTAFDTTNAMGSGPFSVVSLNTNGYVLKQNPYYWKKDIYGNSLPYLSQVTVRYQMNDNLAARNFENGDTGLLGAMSTSISGNIYPGLESNLALRPTLLSEPESATYYLGMNTQIAPFNDSKFRVAMEYAINKQKIVTDILHGTAQEADQPLPPGMPGYMTDLPANIKYTYNPDTAKSLLSAAGYSAGQTSVTFYTANGPTAVQIAQEVKADLEQVGVNCNVQALSWAQFLNVVEQGKAPFYQLAWLEDYHDPSDFLNTLFNSNQAPMNNSTNYSNDQVDAWLNKAQTDPNEEERLGLYNQVTEQVMQDAVWVPLYYPKKIEAVQPWVHGYSLNPALENTLDTVWLDNSHS